MAEGTSRLVLFTGSRCHLCDRGRDTVFSVLPSSIRLEEINVDHDDHYRARYGTSIPVLAVIDREGAICAEKGWPFTAGQVKRLLDLL